MFNLRNYKINQSNAILTIGFTLLFIIISGFYWLLVVELKVKPTIFSLISYLYLEIVMLYIVLDNPIIEKKKFYNKKLNEF